MKERHRLRKEEDEHGEQMCELVLRLCGQDNCLDDGPRGEVSVGQQRTLTQIRITRRSPRCPILADLFVNSKAGAALAVHSNAAADLNGTSWENPTSMLPAHLSRSLVSGCSIFAKSQSVPRKC